MAALQSPLMASPAALAQYANLGALPFATQPANLGALYGAAGMGRGAEGGLMDMSAYQQFNVANLAQYQVPRAPPPRGPGTPPPAAGVNPNQRHGRWTEEEHQQFLELMQKYGRSWTKISQVMLTRSEPQVRSHAQKHFLRVNRLEKQANGEADEAKAHADGGAVDGDGYKPEKQKRAKRRKVDAGPLGLGALGAMDPSQMALLSAAQGTATSGALAGGIPANLLQQSMAALPGGAQYVAAPGGAYGGAAFLQNVGAPYTLQQLQQASATGSYGQYQYMPFAIPSSSAAAYGTMAQGVSSATIATTQSPWMTMTAQGALYTSALSPATTAGDGSGMAADAAALQAAAVQAAAAAYGAVQSDQSVDASQISYDPAAAGAAAAAAAGAPLVGDPAAYQAASLADLAAGVAPPAFHVAPAVAVAGDAADALAASDAAAGLGDVVAPAEFQAPLAEFQAPLAEFQAPLAEFQAPVADSP
ncbi:DNA binding protein [Aureococcus anophagefferens]|nr:DNA binding protein [Aureococcus anophagefferens]